MMCSSDRTVAKHLSRIFTKLEVGSRTAAVDRGRQLGLLLID
jgi:ATP/maltotriose-dependent transcriptional regulator MalT